MNERIRELESQCWTQRLAEHGSPWFDSEKFAELIVRECIDIAFHHGDNVDYIAGHFGVKE